MPAPVVRKGPLGDYGIAQSLVQTPGWKALEAEQNEMLPGRYHLIHRHLEEKTYVKDLRFLLGKFSINIPLYVNQPVKYHFSSG